MLRNGIVKKKGSEDMIRNGDRVSLIKRSDSLFLALGDTGTVMSDVLEDGMVAVEFDESFQDAWDCDGLVRNGNGWYVFAESLETIN